MDYREKQLREYAKQVDLLEKSKANDPRVVLELIYELQDFKNTQELIMINKLDARLNQLFKESFKNKT